jgi:hypothetical protein
MNLFRFEFLLHIRLDTSYFNSYVNKESSAKIKERKSYSFLFIIKSSI